MASYKESPLATRPITLDPNEYYNVSPAYRRSEESKAAIRAKLKRQYQMQLNNPHRKELIVDPALDRWVYARANTFPHFRPTIKTSLFGLTFAILPPILLYYIFKTDRDKKEAQIKAGTLKRKYSLTS